MNVNKHVRPLVTLIGLGLFTLNYIIPLICGMFGKIVQPVQIPSEFIIGYFGFISVYATGRSLERVKEIGKE